MVIFLHNIYLNKKIKNNYLFSDNNRENFSDRKEQSEINISSDLENNDAENLSHTQTITNEQSNLNISSDSENNNDAENLFDTQTITNEQHETDITSNLQNDNNRENSSDIQTVTNEQPLTITINSDSNFSEDN